MKNRKKTALTILNHGLILESLARIDANIMADIVVSLYNPKILKEDFQGFYPSDHKFDYETYQVMVAEITQGLMDRKGERKEILEIVIRRNKNYLLSKKYVDLPIDQLLKEFEAEAMPSMYGHGISPEMMILFHYARNDFAGEDLEKIVSRYQEKLHEIETKKSEAVTIEVNGELKGSRIEHELNLILEKDSIAGMTDEDWRKLAMKYHCQYDSATETFNNLRKGILWFYNSRILEMRENDKLAHAIIENLARQAARLNVFATYHRGLHEERLQLRGKVKALENKVKHQGGEIGKLQAILSKSKKADASETEKNLKVLEKENYYLKCRIEELEQQLADLENEKKINSEIQADVAIEDVAAAKEEKKGKLNVLDYHTVIVSGGKWSKKAQEEVFDRYKQNNFIFLCADETIRKIDLIKNADLVVFDSSLHAHRYYYLIKGKALEMHHIKKSNLV